MLNSNCPSYFGWLSILLTTLFVGLRLANIITWNWAQVTAPFWIYVLSVVTIALLSTIKEYIKMSRYDNGKQ